MSTPKRKDSLIWGIILLIIGFIFFLQNIDIDVWDTVARLWPLILIVWGGAKIYYAIKDRKEESEPEKE